MWHFSVSFLSFIYFFNVLSLTSHIRFIQTHIYSYSKERETSACDLREVWDGKRLILKCPQRRFWTAKVHNIINHNLNDIISSLSVSLRVLPFFHAVDFLSCKIISFSDLLTCLLTYLFLSLKYYNCHRIYTR